MKAKKDLESAGMPAAITTDAVSATFYRWADIREAANCPDNRNVVRLPGQRRVNQMRKDAIWAITNFMERSDSTLREAFDETSFICWRTA